MKTMMLILSLMLLTTISSCNKSPERGKLQLSGTCYSSTSGSGKVYRSLVYNVFGNYIFWDSTYQIHFSPFLWRRSAKEIICPRRVFDRNGVATKELKKRGLYDEVTKYITIINKL